MNVDVLILMGSDSDADVMSAAGAALTEFGLTWEMTVASAHRSPARVLTLIDDARARGLKNWVYTVNAADDWQWLRSLGVDGVFTDRPEQLLAFNQTRF